MGTDFNKVLKNIENQISQIESEINQNKFALEGKLDGLKNLAAFLKEKIESREEAPKAEINPGKTSDNKLFLSKFLNDGAKSKYNTKGLGDDQWGLSVFGYVVWEDGFRKPDEERFHRLENVVLPSLGLKETYNRLKKLKERAPNMFGKDCWQAEAAYDADLDKLKHRHYDENPEKYDFIWK